MKIVNITKTDPVLTVDIEVTNTHSYQLENGIVSHNSTSKLFGLTEGIHLPSMQQYLRWVQFQPDDPLVGDYRQKGYPVRELSSLDRTVIVGFPTQLELSALGMGDKFVTAGEATMEDQYTWLQLWEKYWLGPYGNNLSYTLKFDPNKVSYEEFEATLRLYQPTVRCCSVMPQVDMTVYEYQPEEPISREEYDRLISVIQQTEEIITLESLQCSSGVCPI